MPVFLIEGIILSHLRDIIYPERIRRFRLKKTGWLMRKNWDVLANAGPPVVVGIENSLASLFGRVVCFIPLYLNLWS